MYTNQQTLFTTQFRPLTTLKKKAFENIVGKGEKAGFQHFLLFLQYFLKASFIFSAGLLKVRIVCKGVNPFPNDKF